MSTRQKNVFVLLSIAFCFSFTVGCHPYPVTEIYHSKLENGCEVFTSYTFYDSYGNRKYTEGHEIWIVFPNGDECRLRLWNNPEFSETVYSPFKEDEFDVQKRKCYEKMLSPTINWSGEIKKRPEWITPIKSEENIR